MSPRALRVARAIAVIAAVVLLFVGLELVQNAIAQAAGTRRDPGLAWLFVGYLQPWLVFALLVPIVILIARRFPIRSWQAALAHLPIACGFALVHLGLLAVVHSIRFAGMAVVPTSLMLLGYYLVSDVLLYAAVVGAVLVLDGRRELRDRELRLAEARLHALRAQLQPHFLFNALNSVAMLIRADRRTDSLAVLAELGALLRSVLADVPGHELPLAEELAFSRRYLELERVRFGDRLTVTVECDAELDDALVPQLILQPLVENAVRHGVARHAAPAGIRVRAFRAGARLAVEVYNRGPGPGSAGASSTGTGLRTTRARLASLYGDDHSLDVELLPDGAVARVTVPFHTRSLGAT